MTCPKCEHLIQDGQRVKAVIVTKYRALKSSLIYALEMPEECLGVEHVDCQNTKEGD